MSTRALGIIETRGLSTLIEASDAAMKAANVEMSGWEPFGGGMVTGFFYGDVAAVKAAVEAGASSASAMGEVAAVHVIPRPHDDLVQLGTWL